MKPRAAGIALQLNVTWRRFGTRISSVSLVAIALALMITGKINPALVENLQTGNADFFTPALSLLSHPLASLRDTAMGFGHILDIFSENRQLREDRDRLIVWRDTALRLEAENIALRAQLHVEAESPLDRVTTRVIADPAGGFVHTVLVAAGKNNGIEKGQPALTVSSLTGSNNLGALIGRVVQIGDKSSRLLLITDLNSRVPVMLEKSHTRAILAGDNSERPQLQYLPAATDVAVGERVVTSGSDGILPAGLAVGVIASNDGTGIRMEPLADLNQLDFVQVIKYQAVETLLSPETMPAATPVARPAIGKPVTKSSLQLSARQSEKTAAKAAPAAKSTRRP